MVMLISAGSLKELTDIIEDTVEYFCDKEQVSGELAWTCMDALVTTKLAMLKETSMVS